MEIAMRPPVIMTDLLEEWRKDSIVDGTEPGKEIIKLSSLRYKYLQILTFHNSRIKKMEMTYKNRRHVLQEYYEGNLNNKEDLEEYGFTEPFLVKTGTRSKIPMMLDSNTELNEILVKKLQDQEIVDVCTDVIKTLNNRSWEIRAFMDWQKFTNGK